MLDRLRDVLHREGSLTLALRVRPGAQRTEIAGEMADGSIKVRVHAVAEDGKANEELVRFLAELFAVPIAQVELLSGATARKKLLRITQPQP